MRKLSLVSSTLHTDDVRIFDEMWLNFAENEEEEEAIKRSGIYIKTRLDAGDERKIAKVTYDAEMRESVENPTGQETFTKVDVSVNTIARAAVAVTRTEGALFEDEDTGRPLEFAGTFEDRMVAAERLPFWALNFVEREVLKRNAPPLPREKPAKSRKPATGPRSTAE